jgi:LDH2 family malate/lactate/ureidoglycolate dehydrogenase
MPNETPPPPRAAKVLISANDLRAMVAGIFGARGTRGYDAEAIADALVWANLRGVDSHGVSRVPRYIELFDKGRVPRSRSWTRTPRRDRSR